MDRKSLVSTLIIFTIGAAVGFFAGKKKYEKYYSEVADREIDSVKEAISKRMNENVVDVEEENGMTDEEYEATFRTAPNPLDRSTVSGNRYEEAKRNYNLVGGEADKDEPKLVKLKSKYTDDVDKTKPYRIQEQDYLDEESNDHDKVFLLYYRKDDILCEENEDVIEHIDATVGRDALEALETLPKVWVRNEPLGIDYKIVGLDLSYEDVNNDEI